MRATNYNRYNSIWPVVRRHWRTSWPFLNFTKLSNILYSKINMLVSREVIFSWPYFIKIEPTNRCMLRCAGCLHAADKIGTANIRLGDMDFDLFKKIIDELEKFLVKVSLYSEGEPLIYPRIIEMVKYLTAKNIGSVISSNLNYLTPALVEGLVVGRLTHLIVCLDGFDDDSYKRYRSGGDFNRVIDNIKLIQTFKKKYKSKLPYLEIQTIALPYFTADSLEKIKKIACDLGADSFLIKNDLAQVYEKHQPEKKQCFWLYSSPQFKFDGQLQPCCYYYNQPDNDFGDVSEQDAKVIWNNQKYQLARRYFRTGEKKETALRCYHCDFFKNYVKK